MCEEILVDEIICDEFIRITNYDKNIKIEGIIIPENSTVSGTVDVAILGCTPIVSIEEDCICVEVALFIQKELLISTPDNRQIPLEFGFNTTKTVCFRNCTPSCLRMTDSCLIRNLECRVVDMPFVKDWVTLHPSSGGAAASFDELLKLGLQLMLVRQRRMALSAFTPGPICPPKVICYPVSGCGTQRYTSFDTFSSSGHCFGCLSCARTGLRNS